MLLVSLLVCHLEVANVNTSGTHKLVPCRYSVCCSSCTVNITHAIQLQIFISAAALNKKLSKVKLMLGSVPAKTSDLFICVQLRWVAKKKRVFILSHKQLQSISTHFLCNFVHPSWVQVKFTHVLRQKLKIQIKTSSLIISRITLD